MGNPKCDYFRTALQKVKNTYLQQFVVASEDFSDFCSTLRLALDEYFKTSPAADTYRKGVECDRDLFMKLSWQDYAAITITHLLDHEGQIFYDPNTNNHTASEPLRTYWRAQKGYCEISIDLRLEIEFLALHFDGEEVPRRDYDALLNWMDVHPSGLNATVVAKCHENRERIISLIIDEIDEKGDGKGRFFFDTGLSREEKTALVHSWWEESSFHLDFAIRSTDRLNQMLGNSLDTETLEIMTAAEEKGVPVFVNPYYLSLLDVTHEEGRIKADEAIRMYIFYSRSLIDEFGSISAWEKEDEVVIGEPNAAGWLLPSHSLHRRYPEVAILIPDTTGRACGGLCSSCQRMYGFQSGNFNFDLSQLEPQKNWPEKLEVLLSYYENDTQLRDVLITGGDALMSSNESLRYILDRTLAMIERKRIANQKREKKYAEITRIRLGTRLPVYLPQRVDEELVDILAVFHDKARKLGVEQLVIQTHFETAMEVTPEAKAAIGMLLSAGWYVTNQLVFTSATSLRGHTAKLRKVLNDVGVLPYYSFSVKGYKENRNNFATNARIVQEMFEEKSFGFVHDGLWEQMVAFTDDPSEMINNVDAIRKAENIPFLATDRSVINIPGVGKSLTYRTVGFTPDGRRILEFTHDTNRNHSPIIEDYDREIIIESKSITQYLREVEELGGNPDEYQSIYGYTLCETEALMPIYRYHDYPFEVTKEISNFKMPRR